MRIRVDLSYDGGGFFGWATQPGLPTVQQALEEALATVLRLPSVPVTCAGRTDAGVHARDQVVHLDVPWEAVTAIVGRARSSPLEVLVRRLDGILNPAVRVHRARQVPDGFDARFSALWRRYAYRIVDEPTAIDPLTRGHVLAWPRRLDVPAMDQAAKQMLGQHDFAAFCKRRVGATTVRTVLDFDWERRDGLVVAEVRADAFCHSMVRSLVGCCLEVGEGRRTVAWAAEVLSAGLRHPAVRTLAAHGLVLEEVRYPPDDELAARAERARVLRTTSGEDE